MAETKYPLKSPGRPKKEVPVEAPMVPVPQDKLDELFTMLEAQNERMQRVETQNTKLTKALTRAKTNPSQAEVQRKRRASMQDTLETVRRGGEVIHPEDWRPKPPEPITLMAKEQGDKYKDAEEIWMDFWERGYNATQDMVRDILDGRADLPDPVDENTKIADMDEDQLVAMANVNADAGSGDVGT